MALSVPCVAVDSPRDQGTAPVRFAASGAFELGGAWWTPAGRVEPPGGFDGRWCHPLADGRWLVQLEAGGAVTLIAADGAPTDLGFGSDPMDVAKTEAGIFVVGDRIERLVGDRLVTVRGPPQVGAAWNTEAIEDGASAAIAVEAGLLFLGAPRGEPR